VYRICGLQLVTAGHQPKVAAGCSLHLNVQIAQSTQAKAREMAAQAEKRTRIKKFTDVLAGALVAEALPVISSKYCLLHAAELAGQRLDVAETPAAAPDPLLLDSEAPSGAVRLSSYAHV
jgi:hypothetical protein